MTCVITLQHIKTMHLFFFPELLVQESAPLLAASHLRFQMGRVQVQNVHMTGSEEQNRALGVWSQDPAVVRQ